MHIGSIGHTGHMSLQSTALGFCMLTYVVPNSGLNLVTAETVQKSSLPRLSLSVYITQRLTDSHSRKKWTSVSETHREILLF